MPCCRGLTIAESLRSRDTLRSPARSHRVLTLKPQSHGAVVKASPATRLSEHDSRVLRFLNEFCLYNVRPAIDTKRAGERKLTRLRRRRCVRRSHEIIKRTAGHRLVMGHSRTRCDFEFACVISIFGSTINIPAAQSIHWRPGVKDVARVSRQNRSDDYEHGSILWKRSDRSRIVRDPRRIVGELLHISLSFSTESLRRAIL
jgi:hypothetical protein